jgi:hypothetical protein
VLKLELEASLLHDLLNTMYVKRIPQKALELVIQLPQEECSQVFKYDMPILFPRAMGTL